MLQYSVNGTVSAFPEHYNIYPGDIITETLLDHDVACPDIDPEPRLVRPCKSAPFCPSTPPFVARFFI
jgi:hypothetical protein